MTAYGEKPGCRVSATARDECVWKRVAERDAKVLGEPQALVRHLLGVVAAQAHVTTPRPRASRARLRLAILAPCLPSAVRVFFGSFAMVFLRLAAAAAFLMFFRAARFCLDVAMTRSWCTPYARAEVAAPSPWVASSVRAAATISVRR